MWFERFKFLLHIFAAGFAHIAHPIGSLLSGPVCDKIGRRNTIAMVTIPLTITWIMLGFARSFPVICIGFAIIGFCMGLKESPSITYVSEIRWLHFFLNNGLCSNRFICEFGRQLLLNPQCDGRFQSGKFSDQEVRNTGKRKFLNEFNWSRETFCLQASKGFNFYPKFHFLWKLTASNNGWSSKNSLKIKLFFRLKIQLIE